MLAVAAGVAPAANLRNNRFLDCGREGHADSKPNRLPSAPHQGECPQPVEAALPVFLFDFFCHQRRPGGLPLGATSPCVRLAAAVGGSSGTTGFRHSRRACSSPGDYYYFFGGGTEGSRTRVNPRPCCPQPDALGRLPLSFLFFIFSGAGRRGTGCPGLPLAFLYVYFSRAGALTAALGRMPSPPQGECPQPIALSAANLSCASRCQLCWGSGDDLPLSYFNFILGSRVPALSAAPGRMPSAGCPQPLLRLPGVAGLACRSPFFICFSTSAPPASPRGSGVGLPLFLQPAALRGLPVSRFSGRLTSAPPASPRG